MFTFRAALGSLWNSSLSEYRDVVKELPVRTTFSPLVRYSAEMIHFAVRWSIEWTALQAVDWKI